MAKTLHPVDDYADKIRRGKIISNKWVKLACERHEKDVKRYGRKPSKGLWFDEKAAQGAIDFFPKFLQFYEGDFDGVPFTLTPSQAFIVGSVFGWKKGKFRRFKTAYIEQAKGQGKALALDTPIPTPAGWTTMGAIERGDQVLDNDGDPCNVIAVTEVMRERECYSVKFSDGGEIVADADHLWETNRLYSGNSHGDALRGIPKSQWTKKPKSGIAGIRTTREIAQTLTARETKSLHPQAKWNHRVDVVKGLNLPNIKLPIAPYTLGVWLGDGDNDAARVTGQDDDIIENIKADGYLVGKRQFKSGNDRTFRQSIGVLPTDQCRRGHLKLDYANGTHCRACERELDRAKRAGRSAPVWKNYALSEILVQEGLLHNKHIPTKYLRSGNAQRLALLQGIMDTDGHVGRRGQCEITLCHEKLVNDVAELLRSLGYKCTIRKSHARLNGHIVGFRWRIGFQAYLSQPPVRLARKAVNLSDEPITRPLSKGRMIVACDPVKSVPVRCISVDSPSQTYLAGREMIPTHNSPLAAGIGLFCLVADDESGAEIYSAAVTREQAGILFRDAKAFVEKSPSLRKKLSVGVANIGYDAKNSFFRPISSEKRGLDGKRPHVCLVDEIHEHPDDIVIRKMGAGRKTRRQPIMFEITNSGYDRHSICFQHHEHTEKILLELIQDDTWFGYMTGLDVCPKCADDGKTVPQDGCPDCDDWRNEKVWEKANPNLNYLGEPFRDYLRLQVEEAKSMPSQENIVKRLNFCIWTESITKWLPADTWSACTFTVDPAALYGRTCYAGLDLSSTTDVSAFVLVFPPDDNGESRCPRCGWKEKRMHDFEDYVELSTGEKIHVCEECFGNNNVFLGEQTARYDTELLKIKMVPGGKYEILCRFFLPEDSMAERVLRDQVPYDVWARQGFITTTPGNIIDYAFIIDQIKQDMENYQIAELAFDRWGSQKITTDLQDLGFEIEGKRTLVQFGQGFASMSAPTKEVEKMALSREIAHGGNPVLSWMISNVAIKADPAGNKKPDKEKSTERIDGAVALIMAIGRAMLKQGSMPSVYEERGVLFL